MHHCSEPTAATLDAAVAGLLHADLAALSRDDLLELVRQMETVRRQLEAVDHALIAELDGRGVAHELARRDTATLLVELLRLAPGEATARVATARELGARRDLAGQQLPPLFPLVAAAQTAGEISAAHARVITGVVHALPAAVQRVHAAGVEEFLVGHARTLHPRDLAKVAQRLRDTLDPDGELSEEPDRQRRREVHLRHHRDGSADLSGYLTPEAAITWQTVLDALSAPAPADDAEPDDRTAAQRRHDGFLDAGLRLLRSATLPDAGGTPVTILATVRADQLIGGTGYAGTTHGELIPVSDLLALAAEADIIPVILNDAGGVLAYGRTRRLASPGMRHALTARDGGCSFPGCLTPAT